LKGGDSDEIMNLVFGGVGDEQAQLCYVILGALGRSGVNARIQGLPLHSYASIPISSIKRLHFLLHVKRNRGDSLRSKGSVTRTLGRGRDGGSVSCFRYESTHRSDQPIVATGSKNGDKLGVPGALFAYTDLVGHAITLVDVDS